MSDTDEAARAAGFGHGELVYLQIPSADLESSARFYASVLDWHVEVGKAGFEAPGLIGQWVTDRAIAADAGSLLWFAIENLGAALENAVSTGGVVVDQPYADGPVRTLATVSDPSRNLLGLVHHQPA